MKEGTREKRKVPFSRQSFNKTANTLQGPMLSSRMCLYLFREPQGVLFFWGRGALAPYTNCRGSDQIRHLSGLTYGVTYVPP